MLSYPRHAERCNLSGAAAWPARRRPRCRGCIDMQVHREKRDHLAMGPEMRKSTVHGAIQISLSRYGGQEESSRCDCVRTMRAPSRPRQNDRRKEWKMRSIKCGPGADSFEIVNDGVVHGSMSGMITPTNAGALSALLLETATHAGAFGLICSVERSLVALPPIVAERYAYISPKLRSIPVAILVTPEQAPVYADIAEAAALSGAMRRAFVWREEAEVWVQQQVRTLNANRVWCSARRSPQ